MEIRHQDLSHPVVIAVRDAQQILRARRNELQMQVWRLGKRAPQYLLRALDALSHSQDHLAEEIRNRPDCWIASRVA